MPTNIAPPRPDPTDRSGSGIMVVVGLIVLAVVVLVWILAS